MATKKKKRKKREVKKEEVKRVSKKEQAKNENRILRNFLIGIGVVVVIILIVVFALNSIRNFEYEGVKFTIVKEGNLILYKTELPVIYQGEEIPYNFYLRNDPRELEEIPFEGEINLAENLVMNSSSSFNCDGDGMIAIANLVNLYKISGIEVIKDEDASCDPGGRYAFIMLQEANETGIEQFGPACYNVNINNCEILKATERLMIESFIEINKLI